MLHIELLVSKWNVGAELTLAQELGEVDMVGGENFLEWLSLFLDDLVSVSALNSDGELSHSWHKHVSVPVLEEADILMEDVKGLLVVPLDLSNFLGEIESELRTFNWVQGLFELIQFRFTFFKDLLDDLHLIILVFVIRDSVLILITDLSGVALGLFLWRFLLFGTVFTLAGRRRSLGPPVSHRVFGALHLLPDGNSDSVPWVKLLLLVESWVVVLHEVVADFEHSAGDIVVLVGLWILIDFLFLWFVIH